MVEPPLKRCALAPNSNVSIEPNPARYLRTKRNLCSQGPLHEGTRFPPALVGTSIATNDRRMPSRLSGARDVAEYANALAPGPAVQVTDGPEPMRCRFQSLIDIGGLMCRGQEHVVLRMKKGAMA